MTSRCAKWMVALHPLGRPLSMPARRLPLSENLERVYPGKHMGTLIGSQRRGARGVVCKWLKWMLSGKWGCIANSFKSAVDVCLGVRITETKKPACAGFFICLLEGWLIWPGTPADLHGSCRASLSGLAGWQPRCCRSFRSCDHLRSQ